MNPGYTLWHVWSKINLERPATISSRFLKIPSLLDCEGVLERLTLNEIQESAQICLDLSHIDKIGNA
jgi:hypothetical protein